MNTSENSAERGALSKVTHDASRCQTAILKKILLLLNWGAQEQVFMVRRVTLGSERALVCHAEDQDVSAHTELGSATCRPLQTWAVLTLRFYCKLELNNQLSIFKLSGPLKTVFQLGVPIWKPKNSWPVSGQNEKYLFSLLTLSRLKSPLQTVPLASLGIKVEGRTSKRETNVLLPI